ncbi:hypothetical protein [Paenibacillus radicis (ex Gao et al. 2016)]|uniref:Uncharacterized protein n=1 Tax=Paenibacillus radicis (ex Gao et al. 2016) TaxID=1737354 RepID=A0A917HKN0_9BACL|nr:hypothetical protein [Paenibacillus radicis (ex Gao et al. 2016)]GGG82025.1 hypothetical protein GCM10010918_44200 [Paenibacillus radicis (ex Gao et al. 2016)]
MAKSITTEEKNLQRAKGSIWRKKDEALCREIMENQRFMSQAGELSQAETMEMLALLLNSCRNSLVRVKNSSKPSYYGKPHQFTHRHEMISEIIHITEFLNDWMTQYTKYKQNRRMDNRPSLGRINHDLGYSLDNLGVQAYSSNAAQRAGERFSKQCIALVVNKADDTGMLFESPSSTNAIARINEVMELDITRSMLKGNLDNGLTRMDKDYSVFLVSRDRLLEAPKVVDVGVTMHNIIDDASVRLVALPGISEVGCSKVRLQVDDIGIIYADFVEEVEVENEKYKELKIIEMKEAIKS